MPDQLHGIQIHCTMSTLPHAPTPSPAHLCIVVVGRRHAGHVGVPCIMVCTEQVGDASQHGQGQASGSQADGTTRLRVCQMALLPLRLAAAASSTQLQALPPCGVTRWPLLLLLLLLLLCWLAALLSALTGLLDCPQHHRVARPWLLGTVGHEPAHAYMAGASRL